MIELRYMKTDKSTLDEQVIVYSEAFDKDISDFENNKIRWINKHYSNPNGESFIFGAFDNDKLVGINCFLKMKYEFRNQEIKVLQSCESGVLKSHQRMGIWKNLMLYATDYLKENTDYDAIIGFPNYKNSYPGFQKMGWKTLFLEKNMIMINNGKEALKMFMGKKFFNKIGCVLECQKFNLKLCNTKDNEIEEVNEIEDGLALDKEDIIKPSCDKEWFMWKKKYANLIYYRIKRNEDLVGYIIIQEDIVNDTEYLKILDIITSSEKNKRYILSTLIKKISLKKYGLLRTWCKENDYKKMGFLELKKHINPFIVYLLNDEKVFLTEQKFWKPTMLDLD